MEFDPPARAAGQHPPLPELVQFLKDKNLDGQLEKLLAMSETEVPQMASQFGCGDEEVEQLGKLLKEENKRRATEPSVGGRLAEALKKSGAQIEAGGRKVQVRAELLDDTPQVSGEHRWAMQVYEAQFPKEFVEQKSDKDKIILLLGDRTSKQDLINLMLNYNVGMKLQEPRLEMDMDQGPKSCGQSCYMSNACQSMSKLLITCAFQPVFHPLVDELSKGSMGQLLNLRWLFCGG
jgi:hypothetical protein